MPARPARKNAQADLSQIPITHQRRSTGHKIRFALFVEIIIILGLTCGVSLFGEVQEHFYNVGLTATANTVTATANAYYATATAQAVANPYPSYLSGNGTLAFVDPLNQESGSHWGSSNSNSTGGACQFIRGAYHVSQQMNKYVHWCKASGPPLSNFAFEVQLTITQGDCGGMFFRDDNNEHFYYFEICQNGTYRIAKHFSNSGSNAKLLVSTSSSTIHTGLGQQNKIAVVASGSTMIFYVNEQQIDQKEDNSYTSGRIKLIANPGFGHATDVAYTNAKLWTG